MIIAKKRVKEVSASSQASELRFLFSGNLIDRDKAMALVLGHIIQDHNIQPIEIFNRIKLDSGSYLIPISIFNSSISSLEAVVLYLADCEGLKLPIVAHTLNRSLAAIRTTYHNASRKQKGTMDISGRAFVPVSVIANRNLAPLESVVAFLKDELGYSIGEISSVLKRAKSTIWTAYRRGGKKLE